MARWTLLAVAVYVTSALAAPKHGSWSSSAPWPSHTWSSHSGYWGHSTYATETSSPTASPTTSQASTVLPSTTSSSSVNSACATVSSLVAGATAAAPTIPAQVAWDCLNSVPLNATAAVPWLESLMPFIEWQTTISYLKNPPEGYLEPAIDVWGLLDDMIANVDSYANEYEFEFDLYEIFQRTHDGHFRYLPTLMAGVITFGRPVAMVSYSPDGNAVPLPYVYSDALLAANDSSFQPSAVTVINGEDAISYLENLSQYGSLQDPDALYNNVMVNLAQVSLGTTGSGAGTFAGGGRGAYVYPNATTVLSFANGTTTTYENFARVLQDFKGVRTGQDVYDKYLAPPPAPPSPTSAASVPKQTPTAAPGYPSPVIRQINNLIAGYYIDSPGYEDVAVLSVPSFVGFSYQEASFQQVAQDFIAQSKKDGKTKLIVDVSANAGGTILQGYSLFTNLFPGMIPYGATRFRAHQSYNIMGQVVSAVAGPVYPWNLTNPPGPDDVLNDFLDTPFDYRADVDINLQNFDSWAEKYGPEEFNGDTFTPIIRWNLSDPTTILTSGIIVNGYQNRTDIPPAQPYAAEDVVVLYDGYCASTCTIFSRFMTSQANVRTIAIGGRPTSGPMQALGGVKGTNDYDWESIYLFANDTLALSSPESAAQLNASDNEIGQILAGGDNPPWFQRSVDGDGYVNARDGIREGDETGTPVQFIYEPADCRIYYTQPMTYDVTKQWEAVYDVAWGGGTCVSGSGSGEWSKKKKTSGGGERDEKRTEKQRRSLSAGELSALERAAGGELWTDIRGMKVVGDGVMLP